MWNIPKVLIAPGNFIIKVPILTDEQAKLVTTPIDEIPADKLFTSVPLIARLTNGVIEV